MRWRRDHVSFGVGRDGRWRIRGNLGIDDGRRVEAALTERKDALFAEGTEQATSADAFVDCFDRSLGAAILRVDRAPEGYPLLLQVTDVATALAGRFSRKCSAARWGVRSTRSGCRRGVSGPAGPSRTSIANFACPGDSGHGYGMLSVGFNAHNVPELPVTSRL